MKKIISLILIGIIGFTMLPRTLMNEKQIVLESSLSVYTKEEVDEALADLRNSITNNANEITNIKNSLATLNGNLMNYALKSELTTTNNNINDLNTIATNNQNKIQMIENGKSLLADAITSKGIETASTDSFETMASNILNLASGGFSNILYSTPASSGGTATSTITLGATREYLIISFANGGVGAGYQNNSYPAVNWNLSAVTVTNTSGTITNLKNVTNRVGGQALHSYRIDKVVVDSAESTFSAKASVSGSYTPSVTVNIFAIEIG